MDLNDIKKALEPFARAARGIPDNWRERCVLTFEELENGSRRLNTLKEIYDTYSPTVGDWRRLLEIFEAIGRKDGQ